MSLTLGITEAFLEEVTWVNTGPGHDANSFVVGIIKPASMGQAVPSTGLRTCIPSFTLQPSCEGGI